MQISKSKNGETKNRMLNRNGHVLRSATICIRNRSPGNVLLTSSLKHNGRFVIPGGGVEPGENDSDAALRELYEEAGIRGKLLGRLRKDYINEESMNRTVVYVANAEIEEDSWPEKSMGRQRRWVSLEDAIEELKVNKPTQSQYLVDFKLEFAQGRFND